MPRLAALLLVLCARLAQASWEPEGNLWVDGYTGHPRLFRFETEAWPLEAGRALPDNSRLELDAGALVRLSLGTLLDLALAGPARLTVYAFPAPESAEGSPERVVLKLDEGALLSDGRFQLSRPLDVVLSLPDRTLPLPQDSRFFVIASEGRSLFYTPVSQTPEGQPVIWPADLSPSAQALVPRPPEVGAKDLPPLDTELVEELKRPVRVFVIARDYNQDLGSWPRPAVLGPLLAERLSQVPGLTVVEGSGNTYYASMANTALKTGQDFFLRELATARGAKWVVAGNCVAETLPASLAPGEPGGRRVRGSAEVRILEAEGQDEGLELVSDVATTTVARAGRPLEPVAREAMEGAAERAAEYLAFHATNLLQGRAHTGELTRLTLSDVDKEAFEQLRLALAGMDTVQRVFRRGYSKGLVKMDLVLRKGPQAFKEQWEAQVWKGFSLAPQGPGEWDFKVVPHKR